MPSQAVMPSNLTAFFSTLADAARASGAFERVVLLASGGVEGMDRVQPEASFRVALEDGALWVSWVSPNRYLSQSIEAEVKWTGDDINELVAEEVEAQGWEGPAAGDFEHFRSEDKLFTFRSKLPLDPARAGAADAAAGLKFMLAYQGALRNLGDMKEDEE